MLARNDRPLSLARKPLQQEPAGRIKVRSAGPAAFGRLSRPGRARARSYTANGSGAAVRSRNASTSASNACAVTSGPAPAPWITSGWA